MLAIPKKNKIANRLGLLKMKNKITLSDEAHFHLDGFVNRQNCHIRDDVCVTKCSFNKMASYSILDGFLSGDRISVSVV